MPQQARHVEVVDHYLPQTRFHRAFLAGDVDCRARRRPGSVAVCYRQLALSARRSHPRRAARQPRRRCPLRGVEVEKINTQIKEKRGSKTPALFLFC